MRFLFIVFLNLMMGLKSFCQTEVYFTPSKQCEDRIVSAIEASKTEVVAAVYSINNQRIVAALIEAKKRGVKVQVLTDRVQASQKNS
ncbi:MAG: phospholipase D-like domain-containing protein, partial [Pseudomonadota bacterium]